jgi:hypothetical protein
MAKFKRIFRSEDRFEERKVFSFRIYLHTRSSIIFSIELTACVETFYGFESEANTKPFFIY